MSYPLEPGPDEMRRMGEAAAGFVAGFISRLDQAPADGVVPGAAVPETLLAPPAEEPADFGVLLKTFGAAAAHAVETAGPGYLAYIPGGGLFASALAEFLARGVNRYTGLSALAPDLVAMEESVLRWLCRLFALPGTAGGLLTTGGSMATLSAVVAARHQRLGEDFSRGTLYVTAHTHHCVAKAARVAGFPAARIRVVPVTDELRMDTAAAARIIAADRTAGLRPFFLAGNAGSTDTGTVDPLRDLGRLAAREDLWFHADAAYGGFFQLTERGRAVLDGLDAADSIVLDPHKGLFLPYGTGVLLARDAGALAAAHSGGGSYLQDLAAGDSLPDYSALGPELTREFRGLRIWLPLRLHGVAAFREALDEKLDLARHAHRDLAGDARLEVPGPPDLSTVAFRLAAGDEPSRRLLREINADGRVFASSTRIQGRVTLRLCILSFRTHREHIDAALDIIHRAARVCSAPD